MYKSRKALRMRIQLITTMLIALTWCSSTVAAEVTRGIMLSNSCAACHGTDGKSPGSIPGIYGKSTDYIVQALTEFREGNRAATVMGRHASGYTDEEIRLIAEYFSSLP